MSFPLTVWLLFLLAFPLWSKVEAPVHAGDLRIALEKMNVLGSVLYIAAHPDDENTGLMAYLSKEKKVRSAYLSLTRGDGGQNLIGAEKGSEIGIIRSQELLAARRIDGGEQYFTRAVDFGYSKSVAETLKIWGREELLSDIVWIIRNFRPDVIITRFPATETGGGHGHHAAATILALEAFRAAADKSRFPKQLKQVGLWQAKRILWNKWHPTLEEQSGLIQLDVGSYNPFLGQSYNEIAARSRTMHKSQGFGSLPNRGSQIEYFQLLAGTPAKGDLFHGIDTTWGRVKGGEAIGKSLDGVLRTFRCDDPAAILPHLLELDEQLQKIASDPWVGFKRQELRDLLWACSGLRLEAQADAYSYSPGETIKVSASVVHRLQGSLILKRLHFPSLKQSQELNQEIPFNSLHKIESSVTLPTDYAVSQPYWLLEEPLNGLFQVKDQHLIGLAQNPPNLPVELDVLLLGKKITFSMPTWYLWRDRIDGEMRRPVEVRPPVTANFFKKTVVFNNGEDREIRLKLKNNGQLRKGQVSLRAGPDWQVSPILIPFEMTNKHDERILAFRVRPPVRMGTDDLTAIVEVNGRVDQKALLEICYPHIETQVYFPDSRLKLIKLDARITPGHIGYINGSGDEIPEVLRDMGYDVVMLEDEALIAGQLGQYDTIIAGIRAYNTREQLKYCHTILMDYVKNGGTCIVQYNVASGLQTDQIGPYPFKIGRERITDEEAKMRFINPGHLLLNFPNTITEADFSGWVQERGLYFAESWDEHYEPIFIGHDPDEKDLSGSTLYCRYGKGVFIYSGLAWFRQLPAGVPGAYRLFINMMSAGKNDQ